MKEERITKEDKKIFDDIALSIHDKFKEAYSMKFLSKYKERISSRKYFDSLLNILITFNFNALLTIFDEESKSHPEIHKEHLMYFINDMFTAIKEELGARQNKDIH